MLDLRKAFEKGLDKEEPEHDWPEDRIHVSDLSVALDKGKCPRSLWLRYHGFPKEQLHAGKKLMFKFGNDIHETASEILEVGLKETDWNIAQIEGKIDMPNVITVGGSVAKLPDITGRYDVMLSNHKGDKMILDYKTVRGRKFKYLQQADESYILQVQAYMFATDTDRGQVLVIDREGQNFVKAFPENEYIKRQDTRILEAMQYANDIVQGDIPEYIEPKLEIKENKGDDSIYLEPDWHCSYCPYQDVSCQGDIPKNVRDKLPKNKKGHIKRRVLGKIDDNGIVKMKDKYREVKSFIEKLLSKDLKEVV